MKLYRKYRLYPVTSIYCDPKTYMYTGADCDVFLKANLTLRNVKIKRSGPEEIVFTKNKEVYCFQWKQIYFIEIINSNEKDRTLTKDDDIYYHNIAALPDGKGLDVSYAVFRGGVIRFQASSVFMGVNLGHIMAIIDGNVRATYDEDHYFEIRSIVDPDFKMDNYKWLEI